MPCTRRNFLRVITSLPFLSRWWTSPLRAIESVRSSTKPPFVSPDLSRLLRCLAEVETGNDDTKVGRGGERSRYQISEEVWNQHMSRMVTGFGTLLLVNSFWLNCNGKQAEICAYRHILWLDRHLPRITPTERLFRQFPLAWSWKGGLSSWHARLDFSHKIDLNNYAVRVTNLYDDPTFQHSS